MKVKILLFIFLVMSDIVFALTREELLNISSYFGSNIQVLMKEIKETDVNSDYGKIRKAILLTAYNRLTNDDRSRWDAINLLEQILRKEKNNILLAYLGMNHAFVARDSWNPVVKINSSHKAIDMLNRAVDMDPRDWYVRYLRGNVFFNFPEFFNVGNKVKEDFFYLEDLIKNKGFSPTPDMLITIYYYLGEIYKGERKFSKAIEYWEKAVSVGDKNKITNEEYLNAKKRLKLFAE